MNLFIRIDSWNQPGDMSCGIPIGAAPENALGFKIDLIARSRFRDIEGGL